MKCFKKKYDYLAQSVSKPRVSYDKNMMNPIRLSLDLIYDYLLLIVATLASIFVSLHPSFLASSMSFYMCHSAVHLFIPESLSLFVHPSVYTPVLWHFQPQLGTTCSSLRPNYGQVKVW